MPAPYMLDTNAYYRFFDLSRSAEYHRLATKLTKGSVTSFYIPEIASMEIHSVIGKYARKSPSEKQECKRIICVEDGTAMCSNTWVTPGRRRMSRKLVHDIRKMIKDVEAQRGSIQATIVGLDRAAIERGRELLLKYGDIFNFGSHDALIAGSFLVTRETLGTEVILVSSDKGLKAVLAKEGVPVYDPRIG